MNKKVWSKFGMAAVLAMVLIVAACGSNNGNNEAGGNTGGNNGPADNGGNNTEAVDNQGFEHITAIEPGAGVVAGAEEAVSVYGLDVEVVPSSSAAMATALEAAINNEEWIVVTGWQPHWKFAAFDLKYLDDPENVFGDGETINTIVRQGLEEDKPEAYQVLDQFYWTPEDMESIMLEMYENDTDPRAAAQAWIDENRETVDGWKEGVDEVSGESLDLVYVAWDSEIASTNVIGIVLEEIGYDVELTPVDNTPMWQAVAGGSHDAMVAAWVPQTHGPQYEEFQDQIVDLGPNLEGATTGLVVPSYVTIDSIEEITSR